MRIRDVSYMTFLLTTLSTALYGVEPSPIASRFSLVGVIAESSTDQKDKGIVVLRDHTANRSLTLRTGDKIQGLQGLSVGEIKRDKVHLNLAGEAIILSYTGTNKKDSAVKRDRVLEKAEIDYFQDLRKDVIVSDQDLLDFENDIVIEEPGAVIDGREKGEKPRVWRPIPTGEDLSYIVGHDEDGQDDSSSLSIEENALENYDELILDEEEGEF